MDFFSEINDKVEKKNCFGLGGEVGKTLVNHVDRIFTVFLASIDYNLSFFYINTKPNKI